MKKHADAFGPTINNSICVWLCLIIWTESAKRFFVALCVTLVCGFIHCKVTTVHFVSTNKQQTNKKTNKLNKQTNILTDRAITLPLAAHLYLPWSKVVIQHVSIAQYIHKASIYECASPSHPNTWAETHLDGGVMNIFVFPLASIGHFERHRQCMTVHRCASFG